MPDISAGIIKIDGAPLPGYLQRLRVGANIIIDELPIQDLDGHLKLPAGFDEGNIEIILRLVGENGSSPYDLAGALQGIFRKTEQSKPQIHAISNVHVNARQISSVLIKQLETEETNEDDTLLATLWLEEFIPLAEQIQNNVSQANQAAAATEAASLAVVPEYPNGQGTPGADEEVPEP